MNQKGIYTHIVRIPKSLTGHRKGQVGSAIYNLLNNIDQLELLKEKERQDKYLEKAKVRLQLGSRFEEVLHFICNHENITIKQAVTLSLILVEEDVRYFQIT